MLEKAAKFHSEWVRIASRWVGDHAEDCVQDMYLRLIDKKYDYGDSVNKYYIYKTLKSVCFDLLRRSKPTVSVDNVSLVHQPPSEEVKALESLFAKVEEITKDWTWYDRKLFNVYLYGGMSFRKMSKEIGISVNSIFHTIKECRNIVKENMWEDYQDFINKDYERL